MSTQDTAREWINSIMSHGYSELPAKHIPWVDQKRQQARNDIKSCEIPHRKQEAWRYTSIDKLVKQPFVHSAEPFEALLDTDIEEWILGDDDSYRLVFANGHCIPSLSNIEALSSDIKIGSLQASMATDPGIIEKYLAKHPAQFSQDIFSTMNTAFIDDGLFIHIPKNVKVEKPIEVLYLNLAQEEAPLIVPRNLVVLDSGANATLIERYSSTGDSLYFNNNVTEVYVNDNAQFTHYRVQDESEQSHHLGRIKLVQGADSNYNSAHFALGAGWARTDIDVEFSGKGAHCELNGLYMVKDGHLADFHLNVVHNVSHCSSAENFRGILAGKGRAVFDGRIVV
jgi:Fe-S cluster assembly protein SufD